MHWYKNLENIQVGNIEIYTPSLKYFIYKNPSILEENFKKNLDDYVQTLDGSFVLIRYLKNSKDIFIDQNSSLPFYYKLEKKKIIQIGFDLMNGNHSSSEISNIAIFSIVFQRRLFSNMTFNKNIKKLCGKHKLKIYKDGNYELNAVNTIKKKKKQLNFKDIHHDLYKEFKNSLDFTGSKGLLLSGGLDTRSLLSAINSNNVTAYTLGFSKNSREIKVASKLAKTKNIKHNIFIKKIDDYLDITDDCINDSLNGFIFNSIFRLMNKINDDVIFNGIGIDYMFQGMYLDTWLKSKKFEITNLNNFFLDHNPCGNRYFNKSPIFRDYNEKKDELAELSFDKNLSQNSDYERSLDLFLFSEPSNHYSYTDYLSQLSIGKVIVPTFSSSLTEIWKSLKPESKKNKLIILNMLKHYSNNLYKIKSANNNLPLDYNIFDKVFLFINHRMNIFLKGRPIEHEVRTWPTEGYLFNLLNENYLNFKKLVKSGIFDDFNWIDKKVLLKEIEWYNLHKQSYKFGSKHNLRENNLFYLYSAALIINRMS